MDFEKICSNKEKYYRKAERRIREAGLAGILEVDRQSIGRWNNRARVDVKPLVIKKGVKRHWNRAKKMQDFYEVPFQKKLEEPNPTFYRGYFLM